jgi:hypothetical protein
MRWEKRHQRKESLEFMNDEDICFGIRRTEMDG